MRKGIGILILVTAAVGGCLFGCGGDAPAGEMQEGAKETEEATTGEMQEGEEETAELSAEGGRESKEEDINTKEDNKIEQAPSIELPDGFVVMKEKQLEKLRDIDGLTAVIDDALESIGVQEIVDTVYGNYDAIATDIIFVDMYVITESRKLVMRNNFLEGRWDVVYISDAESGNMYYPITGKNAYDYINGERIHPEQTEEESEKNQEESENKYEENSKLEFKVSELIFNGEPITDVAMRDMTENDYIKDVYIEVDEGKKEIDIVVQVPSGTDEDTAKMAGEDVARYLAACASWVNEHYKIPGSDDIGGIYDTYNLLIYVDDGLHNYDIYGAKVTTSKKITWRDA